MKIRVHGMAGTNHSWVITTLAYVRAMKEIGGHEIYIKSTNGLEHFPEDLRHMLLPGYHGHLAQGATDYLTLSGEQIKVTPEKPLPEIPDKNHPYDLELAYTIPFQLGWNRRFSNESRCRAIIWNFESSILPAGWHRYMDAGDFILPSSQYSYDIFAANGFPEEKMVIVPHGVNTRVFNAEISPFELKTQKRVKFLHNARPHDRKLHRRVIRGYLDTFTGDDDVCLVLKTSFITPAKDKVFEVDVRKILEEEYSGRQNPPEIEVIDQYIPHIGSLYTACDAVVSMSSCEGFCLLPQTLVDTIDGPKPIENVQIGDLVLTHKGNYKKVVKTTKRLVNEDVFSIKRMGCFHEHIGTGNHPVLITNGIKEAKWVGLRDIKVGDNILIPKNKLNLTNSPSYIKITDFFNSKLLVEKENKIYLKGGRLQEKYDYDEIAKISKCEASTAKNIIHGHYKYENSTTSNNVWKSFYELGCSDPKNKSISNIIHLTSSIMEFFGLYIAEGCDDTRSNAFCIASHISEKYTQELSIKVAKQIFNCSYRENIDGKSSALWFNTKIGTSLLSNLFGNNAKNKKIPHFMWKNPHINKLIGALFYGDGGLNNETYQITSSSIQLISDLFHIFAMNGILAYIVFNKTDKYQWYTLSISRQHRDRFHNWVSPHKYDYKLDQIEKRIGHYDTFSETNDYFVVPVRKVEKKHYSGYVYNLEVEDDHSFTSMGMSTHNCLPLLEALACETLVLAPRHGGQLEFLNDSNSLLVNTGEMIAPPSHQYWSFHKDAVVGDPDIEHYKELLRRVYENTELEKERVREAAKKTVEKFNWKDMTQKILDLPIPEKSARLLPKKRTLFVVPYNFVGGGEVWVLEALKQLDRTKFDPEVAFVSGIPNDFRDKVEALGVKTFHIPEESGQWRNQNNGRAATLKVIMESRGYQLVHFYNSFSIYNVLRETIKQGLRAHVVETVHSMLKWPDSMSKVSTREPWVTAISVVTNELGKQLTKMKNKNVVVLPQPIDWDRFIGKERSKTILDQYGVPTDKPVVGYVGRLSPEKNIPTLLKCSQMLKEYSFVLVGDGPEGEKLRAATTNCDNVFFVGAHKNVEDFHAAFDVLLLTSVMEGLPLVIHEALGCGTPVVASDVGGITEVVIEGLNGGVVWDPKDPRAFAVKIKKILSDKDEWNKLSQNAISLAQNLKSRGEKQNVNALYNAILFPKKAQ